MIFQKRENRHSYFVIKIILLSYIKNWSLNDPWALNWLGLIHHWSDHQTKPSIPFLHYFCNLLCRTACIIVFEIILSLYWIWLYCELPGLVILCVRWGLYSCWLAEGFNKVFFGIYSGVCIVLWATVGSVKGLLWGAVYSCG